MLQKRAMLFCLAVGLVGMCQGGHKHNQCSRTAIQNLQLKESKSANHLCQAACGADALKLKECKAVVCEFAADNLWKGGVPSDCQGSGLGKRGRDDGPSDEPSSESTPAKNWRTTPAPLKPESLKGCDAQAFGLIKEKSMRTVAAACKDFCDADSVRECNYRVCHVAIHSLEEEDQPTDCAYDHKTKRHRRQEQADDGRAAPRKDAAPSRDAAAETLRGNYKTGEDMCRIAENAGRQGRTAGWSGNVCYFNSAFFALFGVNNYFYDDLEGSNDFHFSPCGKELRGALRSLILRFRSTTKPDHYEVPYREAMGGFRSVLGSTLCMGEAESHRTRAQLREMAGSSTYTSGAAMSMLSMLTRASVMDDTLRDALIDYVISFKKKGVNLDLEEPSSGRCRPEGAGHPRDGVKVVLKHDSGLGYGFRMDNLFTSGRVKVKNGVDDACPTAADLREYRYTGTFAIIRKIPVYDRRFMSETALEFTPSVTVEVLSSLSGEDSGSSVQASLQADIDFKANGANRAFFNLPKGWFTAKIQASRMQSRGFKISKYIKLYAPTILNGEETRFYALNGESVQHGGHYTALGRCDGTSKFVYHDGLAGTFRSAQSTDTALTDRQATPSGSNVVAGMLLYTEITEEEYLAAVGDDANERDPEGAYAGVGVTDEESSCNKKAAARKTEWQLPSLQTACELMADPLCVWDPKKNACTSKI